MGRVISEQKLKFRINESQSIVNCANNHPITSLFRGQLYEINEQKRDVQSTTPYLDYSLSRTFRYLKTNFSVP